jgi:hypothetical protein
MLLDLPLWAVRDVTRIPLAPSPACCRTPAGSCRFLYIKCTCKSFEKVILLKKIGM